VLFRSLPVGIGLLERIGQRQRQQATDRVLLQTSEQGVELSARQTRPRGIVDQHPVIGGSRQGRQALQHRVTPLFPADGGVQAITVTV
jgi:hypothetical protein